MGAQIGAVNPSLVQRRADTACLPFRKAPLPLLRHPLLGPPSTGRLHPRSVPILPVTRARQQDADLDPIERLVGAIFGRKALEDASPGGLARLSEEASKELYPAVVDVFAEPVEGDDEDVARWRPLLAQTQLESTPLRLAYAADLHGWRPDAFHERVDGLGAALVVAQTEGGAVVGGYNARGWVGLGEDRDSMASFLFTWPDGNLRERPVKLPKVGGASLAVTRDTPSSGIFFGADGLAVPLLAGKERMAKCKLGPYFARLPDGGNSLFAPGESQRGALLIWLQVYVAQGGPEEWQLDGIVWKTRRTQ